MALTSHRDVSCCSLYPLITAKGIRAEVKRLQQDLAKHDQCYKKERETEKVKHTEI